MKAIQVSCPNCGARLRVDGASTQVTCEYCGEGSAIQRRTRVLERVMPPPSVPAPAAGAPKVRYAVQRHTRKWLIVSILLMGVLPAVLIATIVITAVRKVERSAQEMVSRATSQGAAPPRSVPPEQRPLGWQGTDNVLLGDIDGDGTPELVGRGRRVNGGDEIRILALDVATGKERWQSESLGTYTDTYTGPLALAGDLVVHATTRGHVVAIALADGRVRWRATLDERVLAFCAGDETHIIAVGADDVLRPLARRDGSLGATSAVPGKNKPRWSRPAPCALVPGDNQTEYDRVREQYRMTGGPAKTHDGIHVDFILPLPDGGKLLSGNRATGTRVTTIVALDAAGKERWRATAAVDALTAEGAPRHVVVGEREVCIEYYSSEYRFGCFALADGKRLWDEAAPSFFKGLLIVGRALVVTASSHVEVRDIETGNVKWQRE